MSQQFVNRTFNGAIPKPFNSKTFKASVLQSDVLNASSMNVANKSTTNSIDDFGTIDAENLEIQQTCRFYGTVIPNSNCMATTLFVKNQIDNLLGPNVSSALDTITEINNAINNDPNFSNTVMNRMILNEANTSMNTGNIATLQVSTNALQTNVTNLQTTQTLHGTNISNLNTSVGNISTQITSLQNNKADKNNPIFTGAATFNTITTQSLIDNGNITIKGNTNIGDSGSDTLTVKGTAKFNNQILLSDDTNLGVRLGSIDSSISTINSTLITKANITDIDNRFSTLMGGVLPSTLDTLNEISTALQNNDSSINAILSTMTTLNSDQTITGVKTFTASPLVPNVTQGNNSLVVANTNYVDTAITNLGTVYQTQSGMSNYVTTTSANTNYQTKSAMSTYPQFSTTNTFTGSNEFSNELITNKFVEKYTTATVSSNSLSINFASVTSNIFSISPSSATNISLILTNVPTNKTAIYSFTFYINTTTNKNYINSLNVNGSNVTMIAMGGLSNVSVNASSNTTIQNIFIQMNNGTFVSAITNVTSCF